MRRITAPHSAGNAPHYQPMFQISLRSLLVFVGLVSLTIVSLRSATEGWLVVTATIVLVIISIASYVVFAQRGSRQAFGIGLSLTMLIYLGSIFLVIPYSGPRQINAELNPDTGRLVTSRVLCLIYGKVWNLAWVHTVTGKAVTDFDPNIGAYVTLSELPERQMFMAIGHCWWAMLLGWLGGRIAQFAYLRWKPSG